MHHLQLGIINWNNKYCEKIPPPPPEENLYIWDFETEFKKAVSDVEKHKIANSYPRRHD